MYKISTKHKKSVSQVETWKNSSGEVLTLMTVWRWGSWFSQSKPNLENYNPDEGADPYTLTDDIELDSLNDGDDYWEYPENWDEDMIDAFMKTWDEEWHEAPEFYGFFEDDTTYWVTGPLQVEEVE